MKLSIILLALLNLIGSVQAQEANFPATLSPAPQALNNLVSGTRPTPDHESAVIPVPKEKPGWMARHLSINQRAAQGNVDLIYLGDSIVQYFNAKGKKVWDHYYAPRNALNLGISGDRTQHALWRLDHGNIDGISPKLAIVMIGQNNGGHNTPKEISDGVTLVVETIRKKLPDTKILLLAIFYRREKPTEERLVFDEANATIAKLEDHRKIFYMNLNRIFLLPDGNISKELMPDYEHPSPLGHRVWAEAIEGKVAELMGDQPMPPMPPLAEVPPPAAPPPSPTPEKNN
ncbi:GDSL family lipase [bacterium]|nr:GDSL family lipase [bacterium]